MEILSAFFLDVLQEVSCVQLVGIKQSARKQIYLGAQLEVISKINVILSWEDKEGPQFSVIPETDEENWKLTHAGKTSCGNDECVEKWLVFTFHSKYI